MGNVSAVDVGIDVGSTTTKICALDAQSHNLLHTSYERHGARQAESVRAALNSLARLFPRASIRLALTGSGAAPIADKLGVPFVQEVVANACAIQALYPRTRCAIELGGQDAKMIFFRANETTGALDVADMRMNGSCAGGTGAFIDEIASVLNLPIEQFDAAACRGRTVYDISGRCGVYAKTDIQPLLNQGASRDDLALSAFHAIAKQTLGGLAQGIDVCPPIIFEGGPLTFNPALISVFKERLNLADDQAIVPEHPETMVARGAALSLSGMFVDTPATIDPAAAALSLVGFTSADDDHAPGTPFFETAAERKAFTRRNQLPEEPHGPENAAAKTHVRNRRLRVWLGVDSGSTTTKLALVADDGQLIDSFYANNEGDPLQVARRALIDLHGEYADAGVALDIAGVGTTGYGEVLFATAPCTPTAIPSRRWRTPMPPTPLRARRQLHPRYRRPGYEGHLACQGRHRQHRGERGLLEPAAARSSRTSPQTLGIPTPRNRRRGVSPAKQPAVLGSRCTVFMNSQHRQRAEKRPHTCGYHGRAYAGRSSRTCSRRSFACPTSTSLGEQYRGAGRHVPQRRGAPRARAVHRPRTSCARPTPGIMGAIGVALLTREHMTKQADEQVKKAACKADSHTPAPTSSTFIGLDALGRAFTTRSRPTRPARSAPTTATAPSSPSRTAPPGSRATAARAARCVGDPKDPAARSSSSKPPTSSQKQGAQPLRDCARSSCSRTSPSRGSRPDRGITIGLPARV